MTVNGVYKNKTGEYITRYLYWDGRWYIVQSNYHELGAFNPDNLNYYAHHKMNKLIRAEDQSITFDFSDEK